MSPHIGLVLCQTRACEALVYPCIKKGSAVRWVSKESALASKHTTSRVVKLTPCSTVQHCVAPTIAIATTITSRSGCDDHHLNSSSHQQRTRGLPENVAPQSPFHGLSPSVPNILSVQSIQQKTSRRVYRPCHLPAGSLIGVLVVSLIGERAESLTEACVASSTGLAEEW